MNTICYFLLATVTILFSLSVSAASNLLQNPGFETGAQSPWVSSGSVGIESSNVHSNQYSFRVNGDVNNYPHVKQSVDVVAGKAYEFSGWMKVSGKGSNTGNYMFEIRWYDATGTTEVGARTQFGNTYTNIGFTKFTQASTAPAGAAKGQLRFQGNKTAGVGY